MSFADYASDLGNTQAPLPSGMSSYADDLGIKKAAPKSNAKIVKPGPGVDVAGAPLMEQSARTRETVLADVAKGGDGSGKPPTFNGMALDGTVPPVAAATPKSASATPAQTYSDLPGTSPKAGAPKTPEPSWWQRAIGTGEAGLNAVTGVMGTVAGAASAANTLVKTGLYKATGTPLSPELQDPNAGDKAFSDAASALTYQPRTEQGQDQAEAFGKSGFAQSLNALGGHVATVNALPTGAALNRVGQTIRETLPAKALAIAERVEPSATAPMALKPAFDSSPVTGGVTTPAAVSNRAAVLARVGLTDARTSALSGDAMKAATDFQLTKSNEPAGISARAQFDAEKQTLTDHAGGIVKDTGGTIGSDEDALHTRGQTIAAPFDALADHFKAGISALYQEGDQRSSGMPVVQPNALEGLLNERSFKNQLTATNQGHLLSGVSDELANFKENNPQGLSVKNAEQFRQFLNTLWTPDTSSVIGKMKSALDSDVFSQAGEDVFAKARALHAQAAQTLDNPNGISKLFGTDPNTPLNRTTAFHKIPDAATRLDPDQFQNLVSTLKGMPEEIQPQAQAALSEIRAHIANKVLDAGTKNTGVNSQWNAPAVSSVINSHSAKLPMVFEPDALSKLKDLDSAGKILQVDGSYPGAAVQASNMLKRGALSAVTQKLGSGTGALAGSLFGPVGSAAGAALGETAGKALGGSMAEKAALRRWQSGVTSLREVKTP